MTRSVEFACIFRGNVATGNSPVKPPQRSNLNQLASLIPGVIQLIASWVDRVSEVAVAGMKYSFDVVEEQVSLEISGG